MYDKLIKLYPELSIKDFCVGGTILLWNNSDGRGDYIAKWEHSLPKPTDEQLA